MEKIKKILKNKVLFLILSYISLLAFSFFFSYTILGKIIFPTQEKEETAVLSPPKTPMPYFGETEREENIKNILLIGYGGAGHSGGFLADSIILLHVNKNKKKAFLISVPRDIWLKLPLDWENLKPAKINEAYAIGIDNLKYPNKKPEFRGKTGGGNMVKYAITQITGLPVDYFAAVSFDETVKIIDILGGIEVEVPVSFTDEYYPIKGLENETCGKTAEEIEVLKQKYSGFELEKQFKCRYETISFERGRVKMDGATALKFARSRHSPTHGGDFARSERQMAILNGIKEKLISIDALGKIDELFPQLTLLVTTDLDLATTKDLALFLGDIREYTIEKINLSTNNFLIPSKGPQGQFILVPKAGENNWEEIKNYINNISQKEIE